jgi:hypothetical protein
MEKRSTHELNDRRDRRNRATITCFMCHTLNDSDYLS